MFSKGEAGALDRPITIRRPAAILRNGKRLEDRRLAAKLPFPFPGPKHHETVFLRPRSPPGDPGAGTALDAVCTQCPGDGVVTVAHYGVLELGVRFAPEVG